MPRSSGTYSLPAGNPVVTGTVISTTWANNTLNDISNEITNSLPRDGTAPPLANIPFGNYKITGLGAATLPTDAAQYQQIQSGVTNYLTAVAGTDTITANLSSPTLTAYAAGNTFRFTSAGTNTGAVTLNINGLGAKNITKNGATALIAGDITSSATIEVVYDGIRFQLIGSNVADTGPAFSAYASSNQSITSGVSTKVTLDVENFDTNNNFATSRFTPTVAGYYQLNGNISISGTSITANYISIHKNGAEVARGIQRNTGTTDDMLVISSLIYLNGTTDYVELYGFIIGTTPAFKFATAQATSTFSGSLVRAG